MPFSAIAAGNVGQVAKGIESALAKSVPVLIGFLAALLGIGDLTAKVQKIFKKSMEELPQLLMVLLRKRGLGLRIKKDEEKRNEIRRKLRRKTAIVKNENLTEEQVKMELGKLERKEGLQELDADVVSKTEQWHTFMLKAKAGKSKKQKAKTKFNASRPRQPMRRK